MVSESIGLILQPFHLTLTFFYSLLYKTKEDQLLAFGLKRSSRTAGGSAKRFRNDELCDVNQGN